MMKNISAYLSMLIIILTFVSKDLKAESLIEKLETKPIQNLSIIPKKIDFGKTFLNSIKENTVRIKNTGTSNIEISEISLTNKDGFYLLGKNPPLTLTPSQEVEIKVQFIPTMFKKYSSSIIIKDSVGNTSQVELTGEGYPVEVDSDKGNVVDFELLKEVPFPENAPSFNGTLYATKVISFLIDTNDYTTPNQSVNVSIKINSLPKNAVFYKINKTTGEWTPLTGIVIGKNKISYSITDNSNLDSDGRVGYIEDPIVIGFIKTGSENGGVVKPPELGGGGGGCSMDNKSFDVAVLILILGMMLLISRRLVVRKYIAGFILLSSMLFLNCGGSGDGSDVGVTVFVDASTPATLVDSDFLLHLKGDDDTCGTPDDEIYIPASETIDVNFYAHPLHDDISASPVKVERAEIQYIPKSGTLTARTDYITINYVFKDSGTIHFPVLSKVLKNTIYSAGESGEYYVKVIFKLNEVEYDKDLEVRIGFTLAVDNMHQEGECP